MGGSGGGRWKPSEVNQLRTELQKSVVQTQNAAFETNVNNKLNGLLATYNDRDHELIKKHLNDVKEQLKLEIGDVELEFGGSVKKHTYVDGLSDIDSLVYLNDSDIAGKDPHEARSIFVSKLAHELPGVTAVENGSMAVTLTYKDGTEIQLLPAIRTDGGVKIPAESGREWSKINPDGFTKKLTHSNNRLQGKLVPTIKLAKAINSQFPESYRLSGYHIESLAIEVFKSYAGQATPKAMLEHFFKSAKDRVMAPIRDKTGQSIHVDEYLGAKDSIQRKNVSYQLEMTARKLGLANQRGSEDLWTSAFGDLE